MTDGEVSPGFLPAYSPFGGDAAKAAEAAELLRLTAPDLQRLGVIDGIVPEPVGGAHRNWEETAAALRQALRDHLWELKGKTPDQLLSARDEKLPPHLYPLPRWGRGQGEGPLTVLVILDRDLIGA